METFVVETDQFYVVNAKDKLDAAAIAVQADFVDPALGVGVWPIAEHPAFADPANLPPFTDMRCGAALPV